MLEFNVLEYFHLKCFRTVIIYYDLAMMYIHSVFPPRYGGKERVVNCMFRRYGGK